MENLCLSCPCYDGEAEGRRPCGEHEWDCFTITLHRQSLSARQAVAIAPVFRLGAVELKKRAAAEHTIYVKTFLADTMEALLRLDGLAYTVRPYTPCFSRFYDCPRRQRQRFHFHEADYFRFDRARQQQWPAL